MRLEDGTEVRAAELLVATGRVPRTQDLGVEAVGLEPGAWLEVDDTLRVRGVDWLYAVGDVNHRALLTHQGKYQARAAGDVIAARAAGKTVDDSPWGAHVATADHEAVPQVIFSEPEVASVGLTAAAAEEAGYDIRVVDYDLGWVSGASIHAEDYEGRARMVVDEKRRVVLGVTFVGQDVGELTDSPLRQQDQHHRAAAAQPCRQSPLRLRLPLRFQRPLRGRGLGHLRVIAPLEVGRLPVRRDSDIRTKPE